MAIQKRFIHFKKFSDFNSKKLSANETNTQYTVGVSGEVQDGEPDILYQSYVWIKDEQKQWTHGQLYDGKAFSGLVEITYEELKTLRDNSQLVPGQQYRIIDYVTTTIQENTQSAGHQFDIIVIADDESTLNEIARVCLHDGNTYFADSDLNAWQIWYCLDNDTARFIWADGENGKGVIYRMIDEWNNDIPYDFKNIQFKHPNNTTTYPDYYYTFSVVSNSIVTDHSLLQGYCYGNTMKEYINLNKQLLNNNVFLNTSTYSDCYSNSFGNNCSKNSFGDGCYSNSFGNNCSKNSFGDGCYSNSFGNNCSINSFGNSCWHNSFRNQCNRNYFGYCCQFNSFADKCYSNSFGNHYYYNSFGYYCQFNSFRVGAYSTATLKDYVQYNHFDDGCSYNVIWNSDTTSNSIPLKNININRGVCGTTSSDNIINVDTLNAGYEIEVYKDEGGNICVDTFPVPLTTNDIDLIWGQYFGSGGYGSGSASAIAAEEIINSIGVGDYDETEQ